MCKLARLPKQMNVLLSAPTSLVFGIDFRGGFLVQELCLMLDFTMSLVNFGVVLDISVSS